MIKYISAICLVILLAGVGVAVGATNGGMLIGASSSASIKSALISCGSSCAYTSGASSGTTIGNASATLSSGTFTGTWGTSGTAGADFTFSGASLQTNGATPTCTTTTPLSLNIVATQPGAAKPFPQAITVTCNPMGVSIACPGTSPDPQSSRDHYTAAVWCFDFSQSSGTSPPWNASNLTACDTSSGYFFATGWPFNGGGGTSGDVNNQSSPCSQYGLAIDPIDGKQSYRMHFIAGASNDDNSNGYGQTLTSVGSWGATYVEMTFREDSTPKPPAPMDFTPGSASPLAWGGITHLYENDLLENFSLNGDCFNNNDIGRTGYPCAHLFDWSQYHTIAKRVTYDPSNGGTVGSTTYIDNVPVTTSTCPHCNQAPITTNMGAYQNSTWFFPNQIHWCATGSGHCQNTFIVAAYQCTDGSGLTCVDFGATTSGVTWQGGKVWMQNQPPACPQVAYITGATGITQINGLHQVCGDAAGDNPTHTAKINDLTWPGGTYNANSAVWNPMTDESAYIRSIRIYACPGFNVNNSTDTSCVLPSGQAFGGAP
jgi:hypothetical protein